MVRRYISLLSSKGEIRKGLSYEGSTRPSSNRGWLVQGKTDKDFREVCFRNQSF